VALRHLRRLAASADGTTLVVVMDRMYQEARHHEGGRPLSLGRRLSIWWWRWRLPVLALALAAGFVAVLVGFGPVVLDRLAIAQTALASWLALSAAVAAAVATYRGVRSSLLIGSPRAAMP